MARTVGGNGQFQIRRGVELGVPGSRIQITTTPVGVITSGENTMGGWTGKLLRVDMTAGTAASEDIPQEWMEDYIGGRGLADRYLYEEMDPTVDPLSPDNVLIFAAGPLTGTCAPCRSRYKQ